MIETGEIVEIYYFVCYLTYSTSKKGLKIMFNRRLLCLIIVVVSESTMVKRCAWGTCKTDSRYPERLIKGGKVINFHPFPSRKNSKNVGNCGFVLVAGQMTLNVRRIATYAAYIFGRERADRQRSKSCSSYSW